MSNPSIVKCEPLCKNTEMTFNTVTFENKEVVTFPGWDNFIIEMQIVVCGIKVNDIVIPNNFGFGSFKFNPLPYRILET